MYWVFGLVVSFIYWVFGTSPVRGYLGDLPLVDPVEARLQRAEHLGVHRVGGLEVGNHGRLKCQRPST